jgi:hypothetical protein
VLYENGDILFQYRAMVRNGSLYCQSSGIEDSIGLVGLAVTNYCTSVEPDHAVHITRPAPSARVGMGGPGAGSFETPGTTVTQRLAFRNTGDVGTDTFNLYPASAWPVSLSNINSAPLTDTNADGVIDTGPVGQGQTIQVIASITVPAGAGMGTGNGGQLTARSSLNPTRSKTLAMGVAVAAPFAASFSQSSRPQAGVYGPARQVQRETSGSSSSYYPAMTTMPDGRIVQVWQTGRTNGAGKWVYELYFAILDGQGNILRPATRLSDYSSSAINVYDYHPTVAVTPDGRIGITWYRYMYQSSNGTYNYNILFQVLDGNGGWITNPIDITQNGAWGTGSGPNVPRFYYPVIVATHDNRFVLAWQRYLYDGTYGYSTIWYAVRDGAGGQITGPAPFSNTTCSYQPRLTTLTDGSVLLAQEICGKIALGALNSAGAVLLSPIIFDGSGNSYEPAVTQLPNGNIFLAWQRWSNSSSNIRYAVLNYALATVKGITDLPAMSPVDDERPSVTYAGNLAVLTWGDACCGYAPNLYYALLDAAGNQVTPPMIFAGDLTNYDLELSYNGQGNTWLARDATPPANPADLHSTSHIAGAWSNQNQISLAWSPATDADSGIGGYGINMDGVPGTMPGPPANLPAGAVTFATAPLPDGQWYAHLRAVDQAQNWAVRAAHAGPYKIDTAPPHSAAWSPAYAIGGVTVNWTGTDTGAGVAGYDVQVRDGSAGSWTVWQQATTATSAVFTGTPGHTYYFRSVAQDQAGNTESNLPDGGTTATTVAAFRLTGSIMNNRGAPVSNATIVAQPAVLNTAISRNHGEYTLYAANAGAYQLQVTRAGYGMLPARLNIATGSDLSGLDFALPPAADAVTNGGWETGSASGWQIGSGAFSVSAGAAHTGQYGLRLQAGATTGFSPIVTQTLTVPSGAARPTLSWMVRVTQGGGEPGLALQVRAGAQVVTSTVTLTAGGWQHTWLDLSPFSGQSVTLSIGFRNTAGTSEVYLDEISGGESLEGAHPAYLPSLPR